MEKFVLDNGDEYIYNFENKFDLSENAEYTLIVPQQSLEDISPNILNFFKQIKNCKIYTVKELYDKINSNLENIGKFDPELNILIPKAKLNEDETEIEDIISFCGNDMSPSYAIYTFNYDNYVLYRKIKYPKSGFKHIKDSVFNYFNSNNSSSSNKLLHSVITFNIAGNDINIEALCVNKINNLKGAGILLDIIIDLSILVDKQSIKLDAVNTIDTINFYLKHAFYKKNKNIDYEDGLVKMQKDVNINNLKKWKLNKKKSEEKKSSRSNLINNKINKTSSYDSFKSLPNEPIKNKSDNSSEYFTPKLLKSKSKSIRRSLNNNQSNLINKTSSIQKFKSVQSGAGLPKYHKPKIVSSHVNGVIHIISENITIDEKIKKIIKLIYSPEESQKYISELNSNSHDFNSSMIINLKDYIQSLEKLFQIELRESPSINNGKIVVEINGEKYKNRINRIRLFKKAPSKTYKVAKNIKHKTLKAYSRKNMRNIFLKR